MRCVKRPRAPLRHKSKIFLHRISEALAFEKGVAVPEIALMRLVSSAAAGRAFSRSRSISKLTARVRNRTRNGITVDKA